MWYVPTVQLGRTLNRIYFLPEGKLYVKKRHVQIHLQERNGQLGENFRPKKEGREGGFLRNQFFFWEGFHDMSIYEKFTLKKYQQDAAYNRIYYSKVYRRLNMFRAAYRSSSGALNCICSLWFIYPCGDRLLSRLSGKLMQIQFAAPDDERYAARNMLSLR